MKRTMNSVVRATRALRVARLPAALLFALASACGGAAKQQPVVTAPVPARPKAKSAVDYAADAEAALASGNLAAAVKAYDEVLVRDPSNVDVLYNRAYALHQLGDLDSAQAAYTKVLGADPSSADAAINLGAILKRKGELDRAIEVTKAALESDPFNGRLLNNLSVLERESGNHAEAIAAVRKLLMRDKNNVDAYKNLSLVYFDQKKYRLSQTILENALKMAQEQNREDPDIYVNLGMIYLAKDQNGKAMAAFKKAKAIEPDHAVANYNIGALALGHRDYDLAAESYEAVSRSWKDNYDVVVGHGFALQGQGKLQEAATELEKARALLAKLPSSRPEDEKEILEQLMVVYQNAERPNDAIRAAEEYMKMEGLKCSDEDFDGFCGRYNGIKLMIQMAQDAAASVPPPEEERKKAKDASESTIFTDSPATDEEADALPSGEGAPAAADDEAPAEGEPQS